MSKRSYDAYSRASGLPVQLRRGGGGGQPRGGAASAAAAAAAAAGALAAQGSYSNKQLMSAARAAVKQQTELKGMDTDVSINDVLATLTTNVGIIALNLLEPGSGSFNRVGRKVKMQSVRIKGILYGSHAPAATTGDLAGNECRMMVVYDKQPSGAIPVFDAMFGWTSQDGTEASTYYAPLKYDNTARFRVLRDWYTCSNLGAHNAEGGTTDLIQNIFHVDEFIKLPSLETVFSGQSDPCTIADISSGALYFIARAATNTSNVNEFIWAGLSRLRYTDN